jgi:hypothetical protein
VDSIRKVDVMKRFSRILVLGAAVLLVAGSAAAQQTPAEKYAKEARVHKAMTAGYIGNPNHSLEGNMAVHCRQLADLAAAKAERARTNSWVEEAVPTAPVLKVVGKTPSPSH